MAANFIVFCYILYYDLQYLGKYSTDFNEIWYTYYTNREL